MCRLLELSKTKKQFYLERMRAYLLVSIGRGGVTGQSDKQKAYCRYDCRNAWRHLPASGSTAPLGRPPFCRTNHRHHWRHKDRHESEKTKTSSRQITPHLVTHLCTKEIKIIITPKYRDSEVTQSTYRFFIYIMIAISEVQK